MSVSGLWRTMEIGGDWTRPRFANVGLLWIAYQERSRWVTAVIRH